MRRLALLALLLLAACARPPAALRGTFPALTPRDAQVKPPPPGTRVRWGGTIVSTTPERERTCFEVVSQPLDRRARPAEPDQTLGRFVACAPGFYDPVIWEKGREMTVAGTLGEPVTRRVEGHEYRAPVVHADTVYLWPERPNVVYYYDPWRFDSYYHPAWRWWGPPWRYGPWP